MLRKIKVCGMMHEDNITDLLQLPIDYIGFIFYSKSPRAIQNIPVVNVPESVLKVGVFVNQSLEFIQEKVTQGLQLVQLHGAESPEFCQQVGKMGIPVIKAFGIFKEFDWTTLNAYAPFVDYFLFDTGSKQHGGTGKTFDWDIINGYGLNTPYFLSGGLSAENIKSASLIKDDRLIGLDLNSKFELEPGLKNINELENALNLLTHE